MTAVLPAAASVELAPRRPIAAGPGQEERRAKPPSRVFAVRDWLPRRPDRTGTVRVYGCSHGCLVMSLALSLLLTLLVNGCIRRAG